MIPALPAAYKKPISLECCCCGNRTIGRQWYNRDTGYGVCEPCATKIALTETPEYMRSTYGIYGVHYGVPVQS